MGNSSRGPVTPGEASIGLATYEKADGTLGLKSNAEGAAKSMGLELPMGSSTGVRNSDRMNSDNFVDSQQKTHREYYTGNTGDTLRDTVSKGNLKNIATMVGRDPRAVRAGIAGAAVVALNPFEEGLLSNATGPWRL